MDIVIHGTKGGRRTFTANKLAGLLDVTADSPKTTAIGREAYAIRFTAEYTIFSKYKIVRDVRGDKRTGFVGFSLFLAANEKLSGTDIVSLLDRVAEEYSGLYIIDNNLDDITEDWRFLQSVLPDYKATPSSSGERIESGTADDAFIYFKETGELIRYFDAPYQEEYSKYRQILFIDERWKGTPENPLNALRHSPDDLTEKIDLENISYKLVFDSHPVKTEVRVDGEVRIGKIRKKEKLEIIYTQKYRKPGSISGTWNQIKELYPDYIVVDDEKETITLNPVSLTPQEKYLTIKVVDKWGETIAESQIECKGKYSGYKKEQSEKNQFVFEGDEIGDYWEINVSAEGYKSYKTEQYKPENGENELLITLQKEKPITVKVVDGRNKSVSHYQIKVYDENNTLYDNISTDKKTIFFYDEEITKNWYIEISNSDYETNKTESFNPELQNEPVEIKLKKKQKSSTKKDSDEKKDPQKKSEPDTHKKYKAIFSELWYRRIPLRFWRIGLVSVIGILMVGSICFFIPKTGNAGEDTENPFIHKSEIMTYLQGDSLFLDRLEIYKIVWKKQQSSNTKSKIVWWNPLTWFNKGEEHSTPDDVLQRIQEAINKRTCINEADFAELKELSYSPDQESFKEAIEKIDYLQSGTIREHLGNVSALTLSQIAKKIVSITTLETDHYRDIRAYLEGIDLKVDTLKKYQKDVKDEEIKKRIEASITFRTNLNKGEISKIQGSDFQYSEAQQVLQEAINNINDTNKQYVANKLNKAPISTMTLDTVAVFITKQIAAFKESQNKPQNATTLNEDTRVSLPTSSDTGMDNITTEILEYLKGRELNKEKLEEYQKTENISEPLKESIQLCLDFWGLNGLKDSDGLIKTYWTLRGKVEGDSNLKSSKLKIFLDKMCKEENPSYSEGDKKKGLNLTN